MRNTCLKILIGMILFIAAGAVCSSPQFVVYAGETDSQDFYLHGSGRDVSAPSDPLALSSQPLDSQVQALQQKRKSSRMSLMSSGMTTSPEGISLLTHFEGCRLTAYKAVETEVYWTIGYGHYGSDVTEGMKITKEEAEKLLQEDLKEFEQYINNFLDSSGLSITQKQFDALVSFTYNVGPRWITRGSTIKTYLVNGIGNYTNEEIIAAFTMWNTSGGKVLAGLTRRRRAEAALFLGGPLGVYVIQTANTPLNIRSGPGTSYEKVGALSSGTKVIIHEISGNWGRCADGWVSLDYCIFFETRAMVKGISNTIEGVNLSWSADPEAASYNVMRKTLSGDAELVAKTTGTNYVDKGVVSNTLYTYYVNSVSQDGTVSAESAALMGVSITYYAAPRLSGISNVSTGVKIKWKKTADGQKYRILRKGSTGSFKKLADTTELFWIDTAVQSGETYTYTVASLDQAGKKVGSAYDKLGLSVTYIARPSSVKLANSSTGIKVSWEASAGAAKYRIFRRKGNGSWKKLADTKKTAYTDKTAGSGGTYSYRIRCLNSKKTAYTSSYSASKSCMYLKKPTVNVSKIRWGVQVKWKSVTGAEGYYVYRKTSHGSWKRIAKISGRKKVVYKDMKVMLGATYDYRVKAYNGKTASTYSSSVKIKR